MSIVSETRSVCHLSGENNKSFIISTNWRETKFSVTIFSGTDTFTGDMPEEKTREFSNQLGISIENYISECKKALTINGGCDNFIYRIDTIKNVFQWKKVSFDMKIIFGSIELTAVPVVETLNDILNVTVCDNGQLKEHVTQLTEERNLLKEDNKELLLRIDECMNLKNEMEIQLYNQFLTVLNTKKRKICKLEKQITSKRHKAGDVSEDDNDEDVDDVEPVGNPNKNVDVNKNKRNELYDCDTEVESEADSENETPENISKSLDSDPEMNPTYSIPKRNKRNTKDINEASNLTKETNVFKPRNCKRLSDGNDKYDNLNNEPGPSGTKISKTTENKYSLRNKNSPENDSRSISIADTVIVTSENDHVKNIQENVVDSLSTANTLLLPSQNNSCNEATKSDRNEWSKIKDKPNELNNKTKEKVTSSVDDILTRLIG